MNFKGNSKRVKTTNFWGKYQKIVPKEKQDFVFEQYLSTDTLYVYVDMSVSKEDAVMSAACSYVTNASVIVKQQRIYIEREMVSHSIYGECQALLFALKNADKHVTGMTKNVVIYSDVNHVISLLNGDSTFKNESLEKKRKEVILEYKNINNRNKGISFVIEFLPSELQSHNPFYKSAHNAARGLLGK